MLKKTGVPTAEQIKAKFPTKEQLAKPKAILECYEDIPCNPCQSACPFDAIIIGDNMNNQPVLQVDQCTGCGICVAYCPGLAIVVAQLSNNQAIFKIPYELSPQPKVNEVWHGLNRNGDIIGDATILQVTQRLNQNKTAIVTVSVNADHLYEFISIKEKHG